MTSQSTLRLVKPHEDNDVIPLERRASNRHVLSGRVTALESDLGGDQDRKRICSLQLLNISDTGLGAVVQDSVDLQTRIVVFFPPHGPERGFDLYGRIVRCVHRGDGHEIGIRFDERKAA